MENVWIALIVLLLLVCLYMLNKSAEYLNKFAPGYKTQLDAVNDALDKWYSATLARENAFKLFVPLYSTFQNTPRARTREYAQMEKEYYAAKSNWTTAKHAHVAAGDAYKMLAKQAIYSADPNSLRVKLATILTKEVLYGDKNESIALANQSK